MKNSTSPTHAAIAQRAQEIWNLRGSPDGHDTAIWLEAERQLSIDLAGPQSLGLAGPTLSPGPMGRVLSSPKADHGLVRTTPDPDMIAAKAALEKKSARAPRLPTHKNAPHAAPAESGKPLWNQPHSS